MQNIKQPEYGLMPNVMAALPTIGGARRPLFNAAKFGWRPLYTRVPCSNAAETRNPLKLAGVPQTRQQISAASGPKFTISWRHGGDVAV